MKNPNSKSQHGAVLAFSLVMLLLLTLAGTRMIQQNKQQLEMANSARLLTQEFADSEGALADVKNIINTIATSNNEFGLAHNNYYVPDDGYFPLASKLPINDSRHQCRPTALYKQNIGLAGVVAISIPNTTATILSVRCVSYDGSEQTCSSYNSATNKITCKANTDCKTVADGIAAFTDSADICYQDYDPQAESLLVKGKCPKEIYKVDVISTANGTTREIISDHVVGCGT